MSTTTRVSSDSLRGIAAALYGGPLGTFVARRDEQARSLPDKALRAAVRSLPKPSAGAWLVDLMVARMPEEITEVLELGATLRQAQEELDAARLRTLATRRRRLVAAVVRRGREEASAMGERVSGAAAEQAASTLQAAMSDPGAARALRTGLLARPMAATGLGEVDLDGVLALPELGAPDREGGTVSVPDGGASPARVDTGREPGSRTAARSGDRTAASGAAERAAAQREERARKARTARAERAVTDADQALRRAEHELRVRRDQHERLRARSLQLAAEVEELTRDLAAREHALLQAQNRLGGAEEALDEAGTAARDARDVRDAARTELDRLRGESRGGS